MWMAADTERMVSVSFPLGQEFVYRKYAVRRTMTARFQINISNVHDARDLNSDEGRLLGVAGAGGLDGCEVRMF
jgi:hypothetical protein